MKLKKYSGWSPFCTNVDIDPRVLTADRVSEAKVAEDLARIKSPPDDQSNEPNSDRYRGKSPQECDNIGGRVRIVHRGGVVEVFRVPITAGQLMDRYPKFFVTTPDVFRRPWDAVVKEDAMLTAGCKFFLVPKRTVKKLGNRQCRSGDTSYSSPATCNSSENVINSVGFEDGTSDPSPIMQQTCGKSKAASAATAAVDVASKPKRSSASSYNRAGTAENYALQYNIRGEGSPGFSAKKFYENLPALRREEYSRCDRARQSEINYYYGCYREKGKSSGHELNHTRPILCISAAKKFKLCRGLPWYPKLSVIPELSP